MFVKLVYSFLSTPHPPHPSMPTVPVTPASTHTTSATSTVPTPTVQTGESPAPPSSRINPETLTSTAAQPSASSNGKSEEKDAGLYVEIWIK